MLMNARLQVVLLSLQCAYLFSSIRDRGTTATTNIMVPQLAMNATVLSLQPYA